MAQDTLACKYDWDCAFTYFLAGMTYGQISELMKIPLPAIQERGSTHKWTQRRSSAQAHTERALKADLAKKIDKAKIDHQNFMLEIIEDEQRVLKERTREGDAAQEEQSERLNITDKLDTIARRTLKLDDDKSLDATQFGFGVLVNLAIGPLPEASGASTGILRAFNAHNNGQAEPSAGGKIHDLQESEVEIGPAEPVDPDPPTVVDGEAFKPLPKRINFEAPRPVENPEDAPKPIEPLVNENPPDEMPRP